MKILVTGGAGFIGSHAVDILLENGFGVGIVDNFSFGKMSNLRHAEEFAKTKGLHFEIMEADISQTATWQSMPAYDGLWHFAAQTSVTASVKDPSFDWQSNIVAIPLILDWVRHHQVKVAAYANSAGTVYGQAEILPTPETAPVRPASPYGATKSFFETYVSAWSQSLIMSGELSSDPKASNYFTWASLRLANVYGPRQTAKGEAGVVPIFFDALVAGQRPFIFGDGTKTRDYVYVKDVARAFLAATQRGLETPVNDYFNVGFGVETSDREVFDTVLSETLKQTKDSSRLTKDFQLAPVRPGEIMRSWLNISKLAKLNWKPQMPWSQGVRETIASYIATNSSKLN